LDTFAERLGDQVRTRPGVELAHRTRDVLRTVLTEISDAWAFSGPGGSERDESEHLTFSGGERTVVLDGGRGTTRPPPAAGHRNGDE
jgi:hypothetical protein